MRWSLPTHPQRATLSQGILLSDAIIIRKLALIDPNYTPECICRLSMGELFLSTAMKRNIIIALLFSVLASAVLAGTPEMPQGRTAKELMPTEPFPSTYPGFENQKSKVPAQLEGSGEFKVTRVAGICPDPASPANFAMEAEHFIRMRNPTVAAELEKRNIDWEMCEASVVGQKLKVVRLQVLSMGCLLPYEDPKRPSSNPVVQHACFYVPVVEYKGKEQAIAGDALDGFEAFAVDRLRAYLQN